MLFNALVRGFKEYNLGWDKHFTDSTYLDILDWLAWEFNIELSSDESRPGPIEIAMYEIQDYIWDVLCKETGNYQEKNVEPEMVNKEEFIGKTISYFTPILKTYCSEECVKELIDGFINSMKE